MAFLVATRQASAQLRRVACRSDSSSNGVVSVVERPAAQQEEKISKTISSLDALLGEQAKPQPKPQPPRAASSVVSQPSSTSSPSLPWGQPAKTQSPVDARAARKAQQSFETLMGFEGLAPEVVNGRAAMLGFLFAITNEFSHGESVFAQLVSGGLPAMLGLIAAVTLASFAPGVVRQVPWEEVFNKNPKKLKSFGPFTPEAEIINGRAAMMALGFILLVEGTAGAAFFL